MKADHERVVTNSEQLHALRDLFESEIKRIDQILSEREKQTRTAMAESLRAREIANEWRSAMNDREAAYVRIELHDRLAAQVDSVLARQDEARGRTAAWVAAAGVIATLLAIGIGQIIRQGITSADVSRQIQAEAPWNRDKAEVERTIRTLQAEVERLKVRVSRLEQRDEFFCATRTPQLPAC